MGDEAPHYNEYDHNTYRADHTGEERLRGGTERRNTAGEAAALDEFMNVDLPPVAVSSSDLDHA